MNPVGEESGNGGVTEGRDIPWLQDVDANGDGDGDHWLKAWPAVYRDVVIVDASGVMVDSYNLTINSLEEPDSYATLRQMLIDVSTNAIHASNDSVAVFTNATSDIHVLANDGGTSRLTLSEITQPEVGFAEIVTVEYPAQLDPTNWPNTDLVISEIVPDEYIELYNHSFTQSIDLGSVSHYLVSGNLQIEVSSLSKEPIPPRDYLQLGWPEGLQMSWEAGELVLYRDGEHGFERGTNIDDFVAWGESIDNSRIDLARQFRKWEGPPDGTLDEGAIQRIPGTIGNESHSYDNHRPPTPGNAINDAVETRQVIRFTPPTSFVGDVALSYTVVDDSGAIDSATVQIDVLSNAHPWQNPRSKLDVNDDGEITVEDAQAIIDVLNNGIVGALPQQITTPFGPAPFVDCNGNSSVEPRDALVIINYLNRNFGGQVAALPAPELVAQPRAEPDNPDTPFKDGVPTVGDPSSDASSSGSGTLSRWAAYAQALAAMDEVSGDRGDASPRSENNYLLNPASDN